MSWIAVAVVGGSVLGGAISAHGQEQAAQTQADAQKQAAAIQQQMFNTINQQEQPFIQSGYGANTALNQLLGLSPGSAGGLPNGYLTQSPTPFSFNPSQQDLEKYPGFQFALQTGGQALRNADTPGVGALSGAALKDLMGFNQGLASQTYGNYFNQSLASKEYNNSLLQSQQQNIFSRLSGLAGLGQNAASNVGTQGTALGTGVAQATAGVGASLAGGQVGAANAIGNSISGSVPLAALMYRGGGAGLSPDIYGGGVGMGSAGQGLGAYNVPGYGGGGV